MKWFISLNLVQDDARVANVAISWPIRMPYMRREYPVPWERDVTIALWRSNNEKLVNGRIRLCPVPAARAAQMTRPS